MSTKRFSVIGKGLPKIDSWSKVTGATQYADDLFLPRMAYGKLLRSPHPHALITRLDTSRAKALPGVFAVITGHDLPRVKFGIMPVSQDEYPLAPERVRLDQAAEGIVHAQPQDPLQFLVCPAGGRLADQHDDGGPQRAVRREPDVAETPEPVHVERRDAAQRVVAARMAVAGQVAQSVQGAIHRATRGAQRSTHLVEHDDRLAVKEPLQGVDLRISRSVCHYYDYS